MDRQMFVNLPIKNLDKTVSFFTKVGFTFDPQFTNELATCMIIGKNSYVMLLSESFFKTFTKKNITNTGKDTESIIAVAVSGKKEVDVMMERAIAAGGKEHRPVQDMGWMYSRSLEDINGHLWELFFMNEKEMPKK